MNREDRTLPPRPERRYTAPILTANNCIGIVNIPGVAIDPSDDHHHINCIVHVRRLSTVSELLLEAHADEEEAHHVGHQVHDTGVQPHAGKEAPALVLVHHLLPHKGPKLGEPAKRKRQVVQLQLGSGPPSDLI